MSLVCTLPLMGVFAVPEKLSLTATGLASVAVVATGPFVMTVVATSVVGLVVVVRPAVDWGVLAAARRGSPSSRRTASARAMRNVEPVGMAGLRDGERGASEI